MPLTVQPLSLESALKIDFGLFEDSRGALITPYELETLLSSGLDFKVNQINWTQNKLKGTIRGLHFQLETAAQAKIVYCIKGKAWDVLIDLRPESETYLKWESIELNAEKPTAVYVPKGFAHGFQTLVDDTDILYLMDFPYSPKSSGGYRYDDPTFNLPWPLLLGSLSPQDEAWMPFTPSVIK